MQRYLLGSLLFFALCSTSPAFTLVSNTFTNGSQIPIKNTCDGEDLSPELGWSWVPALAKSLALIMSDSDAPKGVFYHWILFNIPTSVSQFSEGESKFASPIKVGKNDFGNVKYNGPCPPKGEEHHYTFTLYALAKPIDLPEGTDAPTLLNAMEAITIDKTTLSGIYSRQ